MSTVPPSPAAAAPAKKNNTTLYIVGGVVGCLGLTCLGGIVAAVVVPMIMVANAPKIDDGDCCCRTVGAGDYYDWTTDGQCYDEGGTCVDRENCTLD